MAAWKLHGSLVRFAAADGKGTEMKEARFHGTMALACLAVGAFSVYGLQQAKIDVALAPLCLRAAVLFGLFIGVAF